MTINVTCDECGRQVSPYSAEWQGWIVLTRNAHNSQLVLCFDTWHCLAAYATAVASDEAKEQQEEATGK